MQPIYAVKSRTKKGPVFVFSTEDKPNTSWKCFYKHPPQNEISLEQFETFAWDRIRLLKHIDYWQTRGKKEEDLHKQISEEWKKIFGTEESDKDYISHHILKLAYCQDEQLKSWFIKQECTLFADRLSSMSETKDILEMLSLNKIMAHQVAEKEMNEVLAMFSSIDTVNHFFRIQWDGKNVEEIFFFKVPFDNVPMLVSSRSVIIYKGYAYISVQQLKKLIVQEFKKKLTRDLNYMYKFLLPRFQEQESDRLNPFLQNITKESLFSGDDFKALKVMEGNNVRADQIDELARQSFPLCMKVLHKNLRAKHHLKHQGRMQYGLFLKAIGLSLEEAFNFWSGEFTKIMSANDFEKKYKYNIKHSYGKAGKGTNYSPYGCAKIITSNDPIGPEQHHGCPFRHFDEKRLRETMMRESNGRLEGAHDTINEIIKYVKLQHYQVACRKYFEVMHPETPKEMKKDLDLGIPFPHPNVYYYNSRKVIEGLQKETEANNQSEKMQQD